MAGRQSPDINELSFALFFQIWATYKGWVVPRIHYDIIDFLDNYKDWNSRSAVLQVFRSAGKSSILGLYITYLLVKDPTLRILVLSADSKTAKKVVSDVQFIIAQHPLARHLLNRSGTWRTDCLNVKGATDARNFSVEAAGIMSNVTGARCDIIIHDDVEVPKNCDTEGKQEGLRNKIAEASNLLIAKTGVRLFVGTPHAHDSIYPEFIESGCSSLRIPLLTNTEGEYPNMSGECCWSEQFPPDEVINRQVQGKTKGNFFSQYLLIPHTIHDSILNQELCIEYNDEVDFRYANQTAYAMLDGKRMVSVSAFWDVSVSRSAGDDSVVAIVFFADDGHIYIHRTVEMFGDIHSQCQQCADLLKEYMVPIIIVETNGVGAFVPEILLSHTVEMGIGVDGRATTLNKGQKILESFEVPLSGAFLHVSNQVASSKFLNQMRDFKPSFVKSGTHDDFIDAAASAIVVEPIRIGLESIEAELVDVNWTGEHGEQSYDAEYAEI